MTYTCGNVVLLRRNLLVKTLKLPDSNGKPFRSLSIFLDQSVLRTYAVQNNVPPQAINEGRLIFVSSPNEFINGFYGSLAPYVEQPEALTPSLADLKTQEVLELLLRAGHI